MSILIGGINENAENDNTGPDINLYMNDESFIDGGITNENPFLIVKLFDENGINTCCCNVCMPSDESLDEGCYPFRLCWSGKIIYG